MFVSATSFAMVVIKYRATNSLVKLSKRYVLDKRLSNPNLELIDEKFVKNAKWLLLLLTFSYKSFNISNSSIKDDQRAEDLLSLNSESLIELTDFERY